MNHQGASHFQIETYFAVKHHWSPQTTTHITPFMPHHYVLWIIESGSLRVQINSSEWMLSSGDAFFAPRRQTRYLQVPQGAHWWSLDFLPHWFNGIDPLQTMREPLLWKHSAATEEARQLIDILTQRWMSQWDKGPLNPALLEQYYQELPQHCANFSREEQLTCHGLAQALFGWCLEMLRHSHAPAHLHSTLPDWLQRALDLIEKSPTLTTEQLAHQVAFSSVQLRRLFHRWLGLSPREYILQRRMEKARILLEDTRWSVTSISQSVGFSSMSSFARAFKSIYGVAPLQWRKATQDPASSKNYPL